MLPQSVLKRVMLLVALCSLGSHAKPIVANETFILPDRSKL